MKTTLVLLLPLLVPLAPTDDFLAPELPVPAPICIDNDSQRPMMGDPHGPPIVCLEYLMLPLFFKHRSCGSACITHGPDDPTAPPPTLRVGLSLACPSSLRVWELSYRISGQDEVSLVVGGAGGSEYFESLELAPFSSAELASACERALGGSWLPGGAHSNTSPQISTRLQRSIQVKGKCGSSRSPGRSKRYMLSLDVSCVDRNFAVY